MRHRLTSLITTLSSWGQWGSRWCNRWPRNVRGHSTPEAGGAQTAARQGLISRGPRRRGAAAERASVPLRPH